MCLVMLLSSPLGYVMFVFVNSTKLRNPFTSPICTRSLPNAKTHPALESSGDWRRRRALSSAAVTGLTSLNTMCVLICFDMTKFKS